MRLDRLDRILFATFFLTATLILVQPDSYTINWPAWARIAFALPFVIGAVVLLVPKDREL